MFTEISFEVQRQLMPIPRIIFVSPTTMIGITGDHDTLFDCCALSAPNNRYILVLQASKAHEESLESAMP